MAALLVAERAPDHARVLVVGAGGGVELKVFAQMHPSWHFVGVDPSRPMLELADTTLGPLAARVLFHHGYVETAPAGPFDAATCLLTMHFVDVEDRLRTLKEIRRRLVPGAPFVMAFPSLALPVMWVADHVTLLQIIAIAAIAVAACLQILRQRRLTAGTALLLLAALWLQPPLAGILVARPDNHIPTFWATPIQVDVVLTSIIALRLLMPRRWRTSTRVQLRVILIPAVLIYSEIFFPEAWDHQLAKCFLVVAVVWLLTARAPLVSADPRRQTRVLCMLLGTQLAILVVYYLAFTSPNFQRYMSASVFVGWLWFAVPFAGNLTARITGSETHSYSGASGLRRHRHGESNRRAEG